MVFNLYLNTARPHARRRFGATISREDVHLAGEREYIYLLPSVILRVQSISLLLDLGSDTERSLAMKFKFETEVCFIVGIPIINRETSD